MLKECIFVLPVLDNSGESLDRVHLAAKRVLGAIFNGYTVIEAEGAWYDRATHQTLTEKVRRYVVAIKEEQETELRQYAISLANRADQLAVYFVGFSGEAEIIDLGGNTGRDISSHYARA